MAKSSNLAYDIIRSAILAGQYPPEYHLREASIADEIGISRTPVREALRRLAVDGYVEFKPNQGAFVAAWSFESFSELISVRAELASMAAKGAAMEASQAVFDRLEAIVAEMSAIETGADHKAIDHQTSLNAEFHLLLFRNCGNRWLEQLMVQTSRTSNMQRAYYAFTSDDWRHAVGRYRELVTALRHGDGAWAGAVFKSHFLASRNSVVAMMTDRVGASRSA